MLEQQSPLKPTPTPPPVASRQNLRNQIKPKPEVKNSVASDYKRRREEFERNRARGKGINNNLFVRPPVQKRDEKSVYEENLRRIRLRNYNSRKPISSINKILNSNEEAVRQEKINALKQQADEQRLKFKNDLEKRRLEAYEKERKYVLDENRTPRVQISPAPPVNMTEALNAIGIVGKQITKEEVLRNPQEDKSARKSWQKVTDLTPLDNKTLIQPTILSNDLKKYRPPVSPRKLWGLPHDTIIKSLNNATIISPSSSGGSDFKTRTIQIDHIFTPEKIATLKATKNLLLGVTFGQFDPKNTNVI